jgi:hypothetical protein
MRADADTAGHAQNEAKRRQGVIALRFGREAHVVAKTKPVGKLDTFHCHPKVAALPIDSIPRIIAITRMPMS